MNLGKLLGAGKSFFGGGNTVAYRLNKRSVLPKFNSGKNPFLPKPAEPAPAAAPEIKNVSAPAVVRVPKFSAPASAKPARVGWTSKLNPFRTPELGAPELPVAIQPEFSLDTVKVVHNDLADADIEIVPVKSHAAAPVAAPALPPARQAWEFLGESLLKSS